MSLTVNEAAIRAEVYGRRHNLMARAEWFTPSGRPRSAPQYELEISNAYLGTRRLLKASSSDELTAKASEQIGRWNEQEIKARVREELRDLKELAADETEELVREAAATQEQLRSLLFTSISAGHRLDWNELLDRSSYGPFSFGEPPPEPPKPPEPPALNPPDELKRSLWEWVIPGLEAKRRRRMDELAVEHEREVEAASEAHARELAALAREHERALRDWTDRQEAAQTKHSLARARFLQEQQKRNDMVLDFKARFESGEETAILEYLQSVFERSEYPSAWLPEHTISIEPASTTAIIDLDLPLQSDLPDVVDYKHVKSTGESRPVAMKAKDHATLYDNCVKQTVLRVVHEVFDAVYTQHVDHVVVNGWVSYVHPATGTDARSCIISLSAERSQFEKIRLDRVDPGECIKSLKGLTAGPLSDLVPVKPIMHLNRTDSRFVEHRDVLDDLNDSTNLAEIPWEQFEHLVRELFSKMFTAGGAEVRVTQATRDGGVDAIAFDPDPIRGGKFVIQAKRYTKAVPVSAVRDLYGTMIAEGAVKGILVTTAHFGKDARTFVKDKPISLIDGPNLVYLLEQHGHKVRIDIAAARAAVGVTG